MNDSIDVWSRSAAHRSALVVGCVHEHFLSDEWRWTQCGSALHVHGTKEPTENAEKNIFYEKITIRGRTEWERQRERAEFLLFAVGRKEKNICSLAGSQNAFLCIFFFVVFGEKNWCNRIEMQRCCDVFAFDLAKVQSTRARARVCPQQNININKWKRNHNCYAIVALNALEFSPCRVLMAMFELNAYSLSCLSQHRTRATQSNAVSKCLAFFLAKRFLNCRHRNLSKQNQKHQCVECVITLSLERVALIIFIGRSDWGFCGASIVLSGRRHFARMSWKTSRYRLAEARSHRFSLPIRRVRLLSFLLLSLSLGVTIDIVVGQRPAHSRIENFVVQFFFSRLRWAPRFTEIIGLSFGFSRIADTRWYWHAHERKKRERERAREKLQMKTALNTKYEFYFSTWPITRRHRHSLSFSHVCTTSHFFLNFRARYKKNPQQRGKQTVQWTHSVSCPPALVPISLNLHWIEHAAKSSSAVVVNDRRFFLWKFEIAND